MLEVELSWYFFLSLIRSYANNVALTENVIVSYILFISIRNNGTGNEES